MPTEPAIGELLSQYALMWQSLVTSSDHEAKKALVIAMEEVRDLASLDDDAWEGFTSTLPGYEEWWLRIREKYLAHLTEAWERMEDEE